TNRTSRQLSLVVRACELCGELKAIQPANKEHRKAHQTRQIAFVCEDCAAQVRFEVEVAADTVDTPRVLA
ncbi:MAG: hypothetical protein ACOY94_13780, partial [Bacillota bacterium]